MKRPLLVVLLLVVVGISVFAWSRSSLPTLDGSQAAEVLRQAAEKSRTLQSARFSVNGLFQMEGGTLPSAGTFDLKGSMQDAGSTVSLDADIDTIITPGGNRSQLFRVRGAGSVILLSQKDLYFRLASLTTEPASSLFQPELINLLIQRWWLLPSAPSQQGLGSLPGGEMTPSPNVLRVQSQVVRVVKDLGLTTMEGKSAYHFQVTIDSEKLLQYFEEVARSRNEPFDKEKFLESTKDFSALGEMWIDQESLFLRQVQWSITRFRWGDAMVTTSFTASFFDFNSAPPITPPKDAQALSAFSFLGLPIPKSDTLPSVKPLQSSAAPKSSVSAPTE